MRTQILTLSLLASLSLSYKVLELPQVDMFGFDEMRVTVPLDHFSPEEARTFSLRYWMNWDHWDQASSDIVFLYICGESTCSAPNERKFPLQVAAGLNALIISLEHRYYGDSQPFYNDQGGWSTENLKWLNSTQALADIAYFIDYINADLAHFSSTPQRWIVCGGSYPGALSAWFRSLYPDHALISWSSSGVINAIRDFTDFDLDIYQATSRSGEYCPEKIQEIVQYIDEVFEDASLGTRLDEYQMIQESFGTAGMRDDEFMFFLADIFTIGVQYGGRSGLCNLIEMIGEEEPSVQLKELSKYGSDRGVQPYMYDYQSLQNTTVTLNGNYRQWTYQYCTEFAWYQTPNPEHPMRSELIGIDFWDSYCSRIYGKEMKPQVEVTNQIYGGMEIKGSNIVFANAIEDPWQYAGMRSIYDPATQSGMTAVLIDCDNCGHCVDLGTPTDSDPEALVAAREVIYDQIIAWLQEADEAKEQLFLQ